MAATNYNIQILAGHAQELKDAPDANDIMPHIQAVLDEELGIQLFAAQVGRSDNPENFTEFEGKSWVHNAPDDFILAVAKMFDGFVAQLVDPESPIMAPDGGGPWDEPSSVYVAEAFLKYRTEVRNNEKGAAS